MEDYGKSLKMSHYSKDTDGRYNCIVCYLSFFFSFIIKDEIIAALSILKRGWASYYHTNS